MVVSVAMAAEPDHVESQIVTLMVHFGPLFAAVRARLALNFPDLECVGCALPCVDFFAPSLL